MSQLIEFFADKPENLVDTKQDSKKIFAEQSFKSLTNLFENISDIQIQQITSSVLKIFIHPISQIIDCQCTIELQVDFQVNTFKAKGFFIKNMIPQCAKTQQQKNSLMKLFLKFICEIQENRPVFLVNSRNGKIEICDYFIFLQQSFSKSAKKFSEWVYVRIKLMLSMIKMEVYTISKILNLGFNNSIKGNKREKLGRYENILRYFTQIYTKVQKNISYSSFDDVYSIHKSAIPQKCSTVQLDNVQKLFGISMFPFQCNRKLDTALNKFDKAVINNALIDMTAKPPLNRAENIYIFNCIHILQDKNVKTQQYREGGMSYIYLSKVQYYYVKSSEQESQQLDMVRHGSKFPIQKWVCIKVPKKGIKKSRAIHQINIVKLFRTASSAYMLKYYTSSQETFKYKDHLLLDATPSHSLLEFLDNNNNVLSLQTKLYICIQIAKGLVFLQNYEVVHLDLKLSNILYLTKQALIKIIDFGESFHKQVCTQKFTPGYTLPYSSPQTFDKSFRNFSSKQDIFSLGIIMHYVFFGKYPFSNFELLKKFYKNQQYLDKSDFRVDELDLYGTECIMAIILLLIVKCLHPTPEKRPQLCWIVVILKECLMLDNQILFGS